MWITWVASSGSRWRAKLSKAASSRIGSLAAASIENIWRKPLGYLPSALMARYSLFHRISKLCEITSLLITTNLSFSVWGLSLAMRR